MSAKSKNLLKTLRILYLICLPIGLSPYLITKNGVITFNTKSTLQTLVAFLYAICFITLRKLNLNDTSMLYGGLLKTIVIVQNGTWEIFTLLYILLEFINGKKFVQILQQLQDFDDSICAVQKIPFSYYQKLKNNLYTVFFSVFVFGTSTHFINFYVYYYPTNKIITWSICAYISLFFVMLAVIIKITVVNFVIKQRIEIVNGILQKNSAKTEELRVR